jgi:hypothetical protein
VELETFNLRDLEVAFEFRNVDKSQTDPKPMLLTIALYDAACICTLNERIGRGASCSCLTVRLKTEPKKISIFRPSVFLHLSCILSYPKTG